MNKPQQRPRFEEIRQHPPDDVVRSIPGVPSGARWTIQRFDDGASHPNGGIWRATTDRPPSYGPFSLWIKRLGANYLGESPVWRSRLSTADPQWWGREAAFYDSELASTGWPHGVRAAQCYAVDDHDNCRDLWLEEVDVSAPSLRIGERVISGLAHWQMFHAETRYSWLSENWIQSHIDRHELDNRRTLTHPAWPLAIERGLSPRIRESVESRITDPVEIGRLLRQYPQVLTHHDLHSANIGTVGADAAIIDWASVGWGPIGHDVGYIALDIGSKSGIPQKDAWDILLSVYFDALVTAGWTGTKAVVRRSIATSTALRFG